MQRHLKFLSILSLAISAIALSSCSKENIYDPDNYLSKPEQDSLMFQAIHCCAKLPPGATHENKFAKRFEPYYRSVVEDYDIRAYFVKDSVHFFLLARKARSVTPMRESIGGKLVYGPRGEMNEYEEIFRTWKMPDDTLNVRYPVLFDKMVKGESLEAYYPKNSGDKYIEFPDGRFYFDNVQKSWKDSLFDSLKLQSD